MSALTVVVAAFMLALVATSFAFGVGILGIPIAILGVGIAAALDFSKRRKQATIIHDQRERARTDEVNFTERDKQTLVSE
jgi:hypothetical protein